MLENNGVVVDLILDNGRQILPVEIKLAQAYCSDFCQNLKNFLSYANLADGCIAYHGIHGQKGNDGVELIN